MRNYATKVYTYVEKATGAHIVKAITMYAGKTVSAMAKCDPTDKFNFDVGAAIALKRLDFKIAQKRQASMRAWAASCKTELAYLEAESRRVRKAMEYAEASAKARKEELEQLETEIAALVSPVDA